MNKEEIKQIIREEIKNVLSENIILSPHLLASWIEERKYGLVDEEIYEGQSITNILNFLKNGRPSQVYIQTIIQNLINLGFQINKAQFKKEPTPTRLSNFTGGPTEPSKGYMGSAWTGD